MSCRAVHNKRGQFEPKLIDTGDSGLVMAYSVTDESNDQYLMSICVHNLHTDQQIAVIRGA